MRIVHRRRVFAGVLGATCTLAGWCSPAAFADRVARMIPRMAALITQAHICDVRCGGRSTLWASRLAGFGFRLCF